MLSLPRFRKRRIGFTQFQTLPQFFCGDETGTDKFPPAPDERAHPKDFAPGGEGEAEKLRHRERTDIQASALVGNIHDHALDPWRIRRRNQESLPVQIHTHMPTRAKVFAMSSHLPPQAKPGPNTMIPLVQKS